ncbi:MAG: hypothetical protein LBO03_06515 [Acidaminococcales bacterium]|nr:hypothetical protein [Acidaminococcales bacterium]
MLARKKTNYDEYDYFAAANERYTHGAADEDFIQEPSVRVRCNTVLRRQVALMVMTTLLFAFYMVMRSDVFIQDGYELTKLKKQEVELTKKIDYLQVTLAKAKAPDRITVLAEKLGMAAANRNMYVKAGDGRPDREAKKTEKNKLPAAKL